METELASSIDRHAQSGAVLSSPGARAGRETSGPLDLWPLGPFGWRSGRRAVLLLGRPRLFSPAPLAAWELANRAGAWRFGLAFRAPAGRLCL